MFSAQARMEGSEAKKSQLRLFEQSSPFRGREPLKRKRGENVLMTPCRVRQNSSSSSLYLGSVQRCQQTSSKRKKRRRRNAHRNNHKQLRLPIVHHRPKRIVPRNKVLRPTRHGGVAGLGKLVAVLPGEETEQTGRDGAGDDEISFGELDATVLFPTDVGGLWEPMRGR